MTVRCTRNQNTRHHGMKTHFLDCIVQLCSDSWSDYSGKIIQESSPHFVFFFPRSHHEVFLLQHSQGIFLVAVFWWDRPGYYVQRRRRTPMLVFNSSTYLCVGLRVCVVTGCRGLALCIIFPDNICVPLLPIGGFGSAWAGSYTF